MNNCKYTPLKKTVVHVGHDSRPPCNGTVKVHIQQMLTDGTVLSDTSERQPDGHFIDLTSTRVLSSLIDELMTMGLGEVSQFLCQQEEMASGSFGLNLPPGQDLVIQVHMLSWKGQDISAEKDGSLTKSIIEEGNSRSTPCWTGKCTVVLSTDRCPRKEILLRLGDGESYEVPVEVEQCLVTMSRNELCKLETSSKSYSVKLIAFEKEKTDRVLYSTELHEVLQSAQEFKGRGNNAFKLGKLRLAMLFYERAVHYLEFIDKHEQEGEAYGDVLRSCNLNLGLVHLKLSNYSKAISYCTSVLWDDAESVKALYRRATAYNHLSFYEEAEADLANVIQLDPSNGEAAELLKAVQANMKKKKDSELYQMKIVFKKIDEEYAAASAGEPAPRSIWEEAAESCPAELATEEAYSVYRTNLDEEEARIKAEEEARIAEYNAANPPKKKKKRKKKKKPVINELVVAGTTEVIKADEKIEEKPDDPDDGMKYEVTAEKTFISKTNSTVPEPLIPNGAAAVGEAVTNGDQEMECNGNTNKEVKVDEVKVEAVKVEEVTVSVTSEE